MAKLIPSGVIQLPNFAELQYKLDRQKQSDEMAVARDLAQYKRQTGIIAPGAMPLVQQEFDNWQEGAKKYAAEPSASNFANLNSAYESYSQAHGYGKFLFDAVKERDAKFYNEPTKWGISVDEYSQDSDNLIKTGYKSFDELVSAASNVSSLRPATQLKPESPEAFAKEAVDAVDPMDFLDKNGVFNENLARKRYSDIYNAKTAVEDRKRNNLIYTAANKGLIGTKTADGFKLNNLGEVDLLFSSPNFDVEGMLQEYGDQGEEIYISLLKRGAEEAYKRGIKGQELGMARQRLQKDLRDDENYYDGLEPLGVAIRPVIRETNEKTGETKERFGKSLGEGKVIDIESAPVKSSTGNDIIKFGFANGKNVIVEQIRTKDDEGIITITEDFRVPDSNDLARLSNGTDGASTRYFEQLKRESKTPKVVPSRSASSTEGLRKKYNY
jgi:hypothetical protein